MKNIKKPLRLRPIKAVMIADPMGHGFGEFTPEDEMEEVKKRYEDVLKRDLDIQLLMSPVIPVGTEIVFYDFGGMLPGCTDLLASNARAILRWAQEHPNSLLVVVSPFTFEHYVLYEAREMRLVPEKEMRSLQNGVRKESEGILMILPNITYEDEPDYAYGAIPEWWTKGLK